MPSPTDTDTASVSGSDSKKRNKLGYHRTAVACGHCRRRKIRCITSPEGSDSRCQNCIRLKKECQFYPVDQSGPNARKSRSNSRVELSTTTARPVRSSSSPEQTASEATSMYDAALSGTSSSINFWDPANSFDSMSEATLSSTQAQRYSARHNPNAEYAGEPYWMTSNQNPQYSFHQQQLSRAMTNTDHVGQPHYTQGIQSLPSQSRRGSQQQNLNTPRTTDPDLPYNTTFAPLERSATMPVTYTQQDTIHPIHSHQTMGYGIDMAQYQYQQNYPQMLMHSGNNAWLPQEQFQQGYVPNYIPAQGYRHGQYKDHPG